MLGTLPLLPRTRLFGWGVLDPGVAVGHWRFQVQFSQYLFFSSESADLKTAERKKLSKCCYCY